MSHIRKLSAHTTTHTELLFYVERRFREE